MGGAEGGGCAKYGIEHLPDQVGNDVGQEGNGLGVFIDSFYILRKRKCAWG